ncbi:MAG: YciI family protein [Bacteroidota bacterium]
MKEFLLLFRSNNSEREQMSPEQMEENMKQWQQWISGIAQKEQLSGAQPLESEGKVIRGRAKKLTDGPYMEGKEVLGGYVLVKVKSFDEAVKISEDCPILEMESGTVEIREIGTMSVI